MAISFIDPEAVASILGKVATSTLKALKYVNDQTGRLDPVQWTFSLTAKGIGLVKNSAGKIFASVKDGKFTCRVLKDGASTTLEEDVKNVILEKNGQGKLVAKTEKGNFEVEEGKYAEEGDLTKGERKVIYPSVKINGATVVRILEGSNGKVAIIGRKMSYIEEVSEGVRKAGKEVEIFDVNKAFGGQGYKDWNQIKSDWDDVVRQYGISDAKGNKILPYDKVKQTLWYKENERWAKWIKENGYEIYDLGDNPGQLRNTPDRSAFYDLEKMIIFNDTP